jgi:hypothetical protein
MTEALLKAKFFKRQGDLVRCKSELKRRFDLAKTYERFVNFHYNLVKIRSTIDETQSIGDILGSMNIANKILEDALKTVNPEKIDDLMNQLEDNSSQIHEVSSILGRSTQGEFDEEAAMNELMDLELPSVPESTLLLS